LRPAQVAGSFHFILADIQMKRTSHPRRRLLRHSVLATVIEPLESRLLFDGDYAAVLTRGGSLTDTASAIAVDAQNDVYYVGGTFSGTVDFNPGGDTFLTSNNYNGNGYVAKYNTNNTLVWVRQIAGAVTDLALSADGANLHVVGTFEGLKDFNFGASDVSNRYSQGFKDGYVLKMTTGGTYTWARTFGGEFTETVNAVAVDNAGYVYTVGKFGGTADFDLTSGLGSRDAGTGEDGFLHVLSPGGNYVGAITFPGGTSEAHDVAVDGAGFVYVTGSFEDTVDFNPSFGTTNLTSTSSDNRDAFVVKLTSPTGFLPSAVWARKLGGDLYDDGRGIAVDVNGNVYTTGRYTFQADFDPGAGIATRNSAGGSDVFVSKLNSNGDYVWAKSMGSSSHHEWGEAIILDGDANVYTTGRFTGTGDFNPNAGTTTLTNAGGTDVFISKLDRDGNHLFARKIGGTNDDAAYAIGVNKGRVFTAGNFSGTVDFDPGINFHGLGVQNRSSAGGSVDFFVSQLSTVATDLSYAFRLGYFTGQNVKATVSDAIGNTYITGQYTSVMDFDNSASGYTPGNAGGYYDVYVAKYAPDGRFLWVRSLWQREANEIAGDVAVAPNGDVIVVGAFNGELDFDPDPANEVLRSAYSKGGSAKAAFIWRLDSDGQFVWVRTPGDNSGGQFIAKTVATDAAGTVYVGGTFNSTLYPDDGLTSGYTNTKGGVDVWVGRFAATNGNTLYFGTMGGSGADDVTDVAVQQSGGNAVYVGTFDSPSFDANPYAGLSTLSRAGQSSAFVAEVDRYMGFVQAKKFGGSGTSTALANGVAIDAAGSIHVVGQFTGTIDLNPGAATLTQTADGGTDAWVVKLNTDGNLLWGYDRGGTGDDAALGVAVKTNGTVLISGYFSNTVDFAPGNVNIFLTSNGGRDGFLWKLGANGEAPAVRRIGNTGSDSVVGVALDALGRIALVGSYTQTVDLDPGPFTYNFTSDGSFIFVLKLLR
jgi:hypothetical protein